MLNILGKKSTQFIFILVCCGVLLAIPCSEQYTYKIKLFSTLTVFAILSVACSIFPIVVPSVLLPVAYFYFGIADMKVVYAPWASHTLWMMFGAFVLCYSLEECGIMQRIAYSILVVFGRSYNSLLYGLYCVGIVLAVITFSGHYVLTMLSG